MAGAGCCHQKRSSKSAVGGDAVPAAVAAGVALAHKACPRHVDHQVPAVAGLQADPGANAEHVGAALGRVDLLDIADLADLVAGDAEARQLPLGRLAAVERQRGRCREKAKDGWQEQGSAHSGRPLAGSAASHDGAMRSEEHTSELQSLMRNTYAVVVLNK